MSGFQVIPPDMKTASNAATEAADNARGHGSSAEMSTASGALRGSDAARLLPELGTSWDEEITDWADDTDSFGTDVAELSADHDHTDGLFGGLFSGLGGLLGGS